MINSKHSFSTVRLKHAPVNGLFVAIKVNVGKLVQDNHSKYICVEPGSAFEFNIINAKMICILQPAEQTA